MTTPAPVFQAARRPRTPLTVDLDTGIIRAGGHRARFDPSADDAIELAYLKLVRRMRDVHREPSFVLRSDDVEALAAALHRDAATVLDRLGELMGATVTQRRSMVTAFLAGALLIAVATGAVALGADDATLPGPRQPVAAGDPAPRSAAPAGEDTSEVPTDRPVVDGDETVDEMDDGTSTLAVPADARAAGAPAAAGSSARPVTVPTPPATGTTPARGPRPGPSAPGPGRDGTDAEGPVRSADPTPPTPSVPPAPPVSGETDEWSWDPPVVDQPGAVIDLPPDPEVVQPGTATDLPGDDPDTGAA